LIEVEPFTVKQARKSTLVVAVVFAGLGLWQFYKGHTQTASAFAIVLGLLLVVAAIGPAAMLFHKWWMTLAGVLGYVNSRILLGLMFYGVMAPTGVILRLTGHDPLERRGPARSSYWHKREATRQARAGYERAY
jgi:glucan phosphoethanolaminetransferase (alkaline phosphatase superfamily)